MDEEKLKEAFSKVKDDIFNLGDEISIIKSSLLETNNLMRQLNIELKELKLQKIASTHSSTHPEETSTHPVTSTQTSTDAQEIGGLKTPNLDISTGNEGVSTDKQTNRQTNRQTFRHIISKDLSKKTPNLGTTNQEENQENKVDVVTKREPEIQEKEPEIKEQKSEQIQEPVPQPREPIRDKPIKQQISEASEILDSLDNIKKEIRRKFKKITKQEMLVFSTIYTLEEQNPEVDYNKIALKLGLSQSSIRDYVQRMINKGIPIEKNKLNNKKIILNISPELKKIASLNTIIKLREI